MSAPTLLLRVREPAELLCLRLADLPFGGLFVPGAAAAETEAGDPVVIRVEVPGHEAVSLPGAVVFHRAAGGDRPDGVGVGLFSHAGHRLEALVEALEGSVTELAARRAHRHPTVLPVTLTGAGDRALNLSLGGMFVATASEVAVGAEVPFELHLPGEAALPLHGEVTWKGHWAGHRGVGVRFLWREPAARSRLAAYLDAVAPEAVSSGSSSVSSVSRRAL